jgi:DNA sulfur modification protein DndB
LRDYDLDKPETLQLALDFWSEIGKMIPDWTHAKAKKVNCLHLRQTYVHSHGVTLYAIGMMGASLLKQYPKNWKPKLKLLNKVNWKRSNKRLWEGRAMIGGKMSKTTANVRLTANVLKKRIGLKLNKDDTLLEEQLKKG